MLNGLRQRASQAGEQITRDISERRHSLRQRLSGRRGSGSSNSTGRGLGFKLGGLSVSADFNETLYGGLRRGVEERVNSGSSLRTPLADRVGGVIQGGISATVNGADAVSRLAQGGVNLGANISDRVLSTVRGSGERNRLRLQAARNAVVGAVDTATNIAEAGLNVSNAVGSRVVDRVSGLSKMASGMASAGINLANNVASNAGGMVSGMVSNAVNSARSATGVLRNPLAALGAARDLVKVSGEAALSVNSPLGSFRVKYAGED